MRTSAALPDAGEVAADAAADAGASDAPASTPPRVAFPPPAFEPPVARTAAPGDGTWAPLATGMVKTIVHPHAFKRFLYVAVVAMDLSRLRVRLVAGTHEPESKTVPADHRPGLVPAGDQPRLLAVFNGGFKQKHGGFGMRVGDDEFAPPKPGACTFVLGKDDAARIGPWESVQGAAADAASWRQTPPCLLEAGQPNPDLKNEYKSRKWGMSAEGKTDIRRSAVGVDATGRILYFGLGEWLTAAELARAMQVAGARDAAELDINWSYTRFLMYSPGADAAALEPSSTLIADVKHARGEYTTKASARDFYYVAAP